MFKQWLSSIGALALVAAIATAHGAPILGTVTAVGKDSITISDKNGRSIVVGIEAATKFLRDKKPAAMSDIQVGSRVVIDAHMDVKTKMYKAEEIQIGVAAPSNEHAPKKPTKR
jgi:hypothetical protein